MSEGIVIPVGVFLLVAASLSYNGCVMQKRITRPIAREISRIEQTLNHSLNPEIQVKRENIFGNNSPEEFYEIGGRRAYLTIDGKSIEEYQNETRK